MRSAPCSGLLCNSIWPWKMQGVLSWPFFLEVSRMIAVIITVSITICSIVIFANKLAELFGLIDSIENNLNKIMDNGKCEKKNTE